MSGIGAALAIGLASYFLGSIPFGLLLTRFAGIGDIRTIGSGNIGATNVLRTGKRGLAAATLMLDGGKGALAVGLAALFAPDLEPLAGMAAVLGHLFPVWLAFKGGKGMATALGMILAFSWPAGLCACLTWIVVARLSRFSSLSALVAIAVSPLYVDLFGGGDGRVAATLGVAVLVVAKHRDNIRRLLNGEESKIKWS